MSPRRPNVGSQSRKELARQFIRRSSRALCPLMLQAILVSLCSALANYRWWHRGLWLVQPVHFMLSCLAFPTYIAQTRDLNSIKHNSVHCAKRALLGHTFWCPGAEDSHTDLGDTPKIRRSRCEARVGHARSPKRLPQEIILALAVQMRCG